MAVKNFCYCIGGTGTRVAEVAGHLCAMNMVGEQDITFIVVDKDTNCGGTAQALRLLETVTVLSDVHHNPDIAIVRPENRQKEFCKSNLKVYNWDFSDTMQGLTQSFDGEVSLKDSITSRDGLTQMFNDASLFDAFYSKKEQEKDTAKGFYGHPSIGALIFKYMVEKGDWNKGAINESDIAFPIKSYLANNPADAVKVFIIGSVFGGTGASIFSNIAAHIRRTVNPADNRRVFISGSLLLPYFTFATKKNGYINPTEFYSKSVVALEQYGNDPYLMRTPGNPNGSFDSLYVCGQEPLHCTSRIYSEGGKDQINHFDFVDLVAAQALTQFFTAGLENDPSEPNAFHLAPSYKKGIYEYRYDATDGPNIPVVDLGNTPELGKYLKAMTAFCTYFICKIYTSIIFDNPNHSFVLNRLFTPAELGNYAGETSDKVNEIIRRVFGYCCSFVDFMNDMAYNGHDWSGGTAASYEQLYNLFSREYFDKLRLVISLLENGNFKNAAETMNSSFCRTGTFGGDKGYSEYVVGANGVSVNAIDDYLEKQFKHVAQRFAANQVPVNARIGDIIHEAFRFCFDRS